MKTQRKLHQRYPWQKWFASSCFVLTRGVEYDCLPHCMAQMVRNRAVKEGRVVGVYLDAEDRITVTVGTNQRSKSNGRV